MDKPTQDYYEALFETFATPGWQIIKAELADRMNNYTKVVMENVKDPNEFFIAKGAYGELSLMLGSENLAHATYDQLMSEDSVEAIDE